MKALFDLCSVQLKERLRKERKEKLWQPRHEDSLASIQKKLNDFNNKPNAIVKNSASSEAVTSPYPYHDNEENKEKEKPKNNDDVIIDIF
jgi:hypothetical protein